jgi:hypothetical protein
MVRPCTAACGSDQSAEQLRALLSAAGVEIERAEPLCLGLLPLVGEFAARLLASGWKHRRLAQVKMKFGSLRIHVRREGESDAFLEWARAVEAELRTRSVQEASACTTSSHAPAGET